MSDGIRHFLWSGKKYNFVSRRYWNHFFSYAVFLEIRNLQSKAILPIGADVLVQDMWGLAEQARSDFDTFENWYEFFQLSCDLLADDLFVNPNSPENWFDRNHSHYCNRQVGLCRLAQRCVGFTGPDSWTDRILISHKSLREIKGVRLAKDLLPQKQDIIYFK